MNVYACCLRVHVHVKDMAQDNVCIMYGIPTSPLPVAAIHQSSSLPVAPRWYAVLCLRHGWHLSRLALALALAMVALVA
jgi:hypothetical protein